MSDAVPPSGPAPGNTRNQGPPVPMATAQPLSGTALGAAGEPPPVSSAAPAPVDLDTMWLGPADEAGQQVYLKFLYDVLLPRAFADGGPQDLPKRGAAAYTAERDAALDYLRRCGVNTGTVHEVNKITLHAEHELKEFAILRWVTVSGRGAAVTAQKEREREIIKSCTSNQQLMLIAASCCRDGFYDLTKVPPHLVFDSYPSADERISLCRITGTYARTAME